MTTREAAAVLGIEIPSVSRLIKRGLLKAEKFGPVWMVTRESIQAYIDQTAGKSKYDPTRGKAN